MAAPYIARWNASRVSGNFIRQGWDELAARMRESMAEARDLPGPARIENRNIRISGDMAWVTFTRRYENEVAHRAGPDPAHHLQILERSDGRWNWCSSAI